MEFHRAHGSRLNSAETLETPIFRGFGPCFWNEKLRSTSKFLRAHGSAVFCGVGDTGTNAIKKKKSKSIGKNTMNLAGDSPLGPEQYAWCALTGRYDEDGRPVGGQCGVMIMIHLDSVMIAISTVLVIAVRSGLLKSGGLWSPGV